MRTTYEELTSEPLHPIDIVETHAVANDWEFDRVSDDQITLAIEGQWKIYPITLNWSAYDETLMILGTFELDAPEDKLHALYEVINLVNDSLWSGHFTYWADMKMVVFKYGLILTDTDGAASGQIITMMNCATDNCDQFYPAFQVTVYANHSPQEAFKLAIGEEYGTA